MEKVHLANLLISIANNDESSFVRLFEMYKGKVYSYLLKITGSVNVAEDGLQDIFLILWKNRSGLDKINNFDAYIGRIAQHKAYEGFRKKVREELAKLQCENKSLHNDNPEHALLSKEINTKVNELINQLTPQQRSAYLLSRENGLKHKEIAEKMGISVLTVKKHISLANQILKQAISYYSLLLTGIFFL